MKEYSSETGAPLPEIDPECYAPGATPLPVVLTTPNDEFAHLPLAAIAPSLTNPRKTFNQVKLAELAESIKASGVHQPILVRVLPGSRVEDTSWEPRSLHRREVRPTHEIIAGERRYRAALLAGLSTIPAMIRAMTDEQVMEAQLVENLQRDDLTSLEEAEGYEHLCSATGIRKEDIGAKIGRSRTYVYGRLKLLDLSQECKQALRDGLIDLSRAEKIARIPDHKLQLKALEFAAKPQGYPPEPPSVRLLQIWLRDNVMLRLEHAVFKITDSRLVESAGNCPDCPKRTGANPDLFSDIDGADICTDPPCYHAKEDAHRAQLIKKAEAKGMRIVEGKEALEMLDGCQYWNKPEGYTDLAGKRPDLSEEGDRPATLGQLLGKDAPAPILFVHPRTQVITELVIEAEAEAVLLAKGLIKFEDQRAEQFASLDKELTHLQERAKVETERAISAAMDEATANAIHQATAAQAKTLLAGDVLRAFLLCELDEYDGELTVARCARHEFADGVDEMDSITAHLQRMGDTDLLRTTAHFLLDRARFTSNQPDNSVAAALAKLLGIDTKAVTKSAVATVRAEYADRIKSIQAQISAPKSPVPLASAAQAKGGGGKSPEGAKNQSPAAPARKRKMSADQAQAAIAAAMQESETDSGAADATQGIDASLEPVSGFALTVGAPEDEPGHAGHALYQQALALITRDQKTSVRLLKAELSIGTTKALELMDALEQAGKVSACDERGARKVLVVV